MIGTVFEDSKLGLEGPLRKVRARQLSLCALVGNGLVVAQLPVCLIPAARCGFIRTWSPLLLNAAALEMCSFYRADRRPDR